MQGKSDKKTRIKQSTKGRIRRDIAPYANRPKNPAQVQKLKESKEKK